MNQPESDPRLIAGSPMPSAFARLMDRLLPDAPSSDWAFNFTLHRISNYDTYRAFLTRFGLWLGLVLVFVAAPAPWWAWIALLPAPLQTVLESLSQAHLSNQDATVSPSGKFPAALLRLAIRTTERASGRMLFNLTGAIGAVATSAQLAAVLFALPAEGQVWARPVGLVLALAYLTSGLSAVMLDSPWYNPDNHGNLWRPGRLLRRITGPLACLVTFLLAAITPWPGTPLVMVAVICAIPMQIALKTREADRHVRVGSELLIRENTAARQRFFDALHGQLTGPVKMTSRLIAQHDPPTDPQLRELGLVLPLLLSSTAAMVDEQQWAQNSGRVSMREIVQALSARSQVRTRYRESGSPGATAKDLALLVLSNLIPNAAMATHELQARRRRDAKSADRRSGAAAGPPLVIEVGVIADDEKTTVEVTDPAPPVPPELWCAPGTSLLLLAERLRSLGGELTQLEGAAGKTIRATWNTSPRAAPDGAPTTLDRLAD